LKAKCDEVLSTSAFNFNLRRYTKGAGAAKTRAKLMEKDQEIARLATELESEAAKSARGGRRHSQPASGVGRGLHSSTFQLNLSRFGHTSQFFLSTRLRRKHAPNICHKMSLR
jgi:hypothetical protein